MAQILKPLSHPSVLLDAERASCVWCRTFLPSGRAGAGWDSRSRSPSRWSAMMESSTPPPSPSPTPLNRGPDPTAVLLVPSCGHIVPLRHPQPLHPHHPPRWAGSGTAKGLTTVVTQACRQGRRPCRCCHSDTYSVCVLFLYVCFEWLSEKMCACTFQRGSRTCEELHTDSETLHQRATVIIGSAKESWGEKKDKVKENTWYTWIISLAPPRGLLWTCQTPHSEDLDIQDLHPKRRWICLLTLTTTWYVQEAFCFYMPVGLEAVFTMPSFYRGHVFTEKLVDLSFVCKGNICKSNIVFTDQGILLYYFIHIIFYKLLPRYILMFFVWYHIVSSLLLPNRICPVVDSYLSFASMGWSWWKWLVVRLY